MFQTLHAGRQQGMNGYQPLTITDVMAYCALAGIPDPQDRLELLQAVQAMDAEFMKWVSEERKKMERAHS